MNQAIYYIVKYSKESAFRSLKSMSECLADEIIKASQVSINFQSNQPINFVVAFRVLKETQLHSERRMKSRESQRATVERAVLSQQLLDLLAPATTRRERNRQLE